MVEEILTTAGFVEGKTFTETRFLTPPKTTYAVYMDSFRAYGADNRLLIRDHDYTIELYSYKPDADAEKRVEDAFDFFGIEYEKEERYWINEEKLFQVIYTFNVLEK